MMPTPNEDQRPAPRRERRGGSGLDVRAQQARLRAAFGKSSYIEMAAVGCIALIWLMAGAYYFLLPSVYTSRWSLILPTSNSNSSVTLETIGQATNMPSQPFGNVTMSPKVIYKEIVASDQVRDQAAGSMGLDSSKFGRVRVRLIDETSLMMLQITGRTALEAQAKGRAVIAAFDAQLEQLRRDEFEKRATLMRDNLTIYQANLDKSRERILEFQRASGLMSVNQFTEASATVEVIRRKLAEKRADLEKVATETRILTSRVGLAPDLAAAGLRLAANPSFFRMAAAFSDANAIVQENALRLGPNHPALVEALMKRQGTFAEILKIARGAGIDRTIDLEKLVLYLNGSTQSELLRTIVTNEALLTGLNREVPSLEAELRRLEADMARMGMDAARLEALKKDHLVAEAVFTSAAARLDTNRTDVFSSYPLVQVLAEPDLATDRTEPRRLYAVLAGVLGTLLVLLALAVKWVGEKFRHRRPIGRKAPSHRAGAAA